MMSIYLAIYLSRKDGPYHTDWAAAIANLENRRGAAAVPGTRNEGNNSAGCPATGRGIKIE